MSLPFTPLNFGWTSPLTGLLPFLVAEIFDNKLVSAKGKIFCNNCTYTVGCCDFVFLKTGQVLGRRLSSIHKIYELFSVKISCNICTFSKGCSDFLFQNTVPVLERRPSSINKILKSVFFFIQSSPFYFYFCFLICYKLLYNLKKSVKNIFLNRTKFIKNLFIFIALFWNISSLLKSA